MTSIVRVQFDGSLSVRMFPTPRKLLGCCRKDQFSIDQDLLLSGKTAVFQFHLTGRRFSRCEKTNLSRFYHWIIYIYTYIHQLMCQKTRKIHQLTHLFIDSSAIPGSPPIVTFNSVASKKKVQAWRNFEDFMCRPMWSTWYCGDRIPQNSASSIPPPGWWFPPNSLEFFSKLLPQLDGVTTLMSFPNTESLENFRNNFTKFGGFLFHKKNARHRFERFIYHI